MKKTVTGNAEALKAVKNGKSASKSPMGGTGRTSFKGSNDTRAAGAIGPNEKLKTSVGYADSAPVSIGDTSASSGHTKKGAAGSLAGAVTPAKETLTGGMGGKFKSKLGKW